MSTSHAVTPASSSLGRLRRAQSEVSHQVFVDESVMVFPLYYCTAGTRPEVFFRLGEGRNDVTESK